MSALTRRGERYFAHSQSAYYGTQASVCGLAEIQALSHIAFLYCNSYRTSTCTAGNLAGYYHNILASACPDVPGILSPCDQYLQQQHNATSNIPLHCYIRFYQGFTPFCLITHRCNISCLSRFPFSTLKSLPVIE